MHHGGVLIAMLAFAGLGCGTRAQQTAPTPHVAAAEPLPPSEDVFVVDLFVLERPAGDRTLNRSLWEQADEQLVDLGEKRGLEENGFRVGRVLGLLPAPLQSLLKSERSCVSSRRSHLHAGSVKLVEIGPVRKECRFALHRDDRTEEVKLDQGQVLLQVVPSAAVDGKTRLRFTPVVRHGPERVEPYVIQESAGPRRWGMEARQATEEYPWAGWEVTLGANEWAMVGARLDAAGTLGPTCFLHEATKAPMQRLLVFRTARWAGEGADDTGGKSASVAARAGFVGVRGSAP